jgi:transcriptional regulator with XRE-family HTH domain
MAQSTIGRYESGAVKPAPKALATLADVLGCATTFLAPLPRRPQLVDIRERSGMTMADIAFSVGSAESTVMRVERGHVRPTDAGRWADAYGIDVDTFDAAWQHAAGDPQP